MFLVLLTLLSLGTVANSYSISGFTPFAAEDKTKTSGGLIKYKFQLVELDPFLPYSSISGIVVDGTNDAFDRFVAGASWENPTRSSGFYLHMYQLRHGKYHLTSISDISGPAFNSNKGVIPGSDKMDPEVVLLGSDTGAVTVLLRDDDSGVYQVDGKIDDAYPILDVPDDVTWRLTKGENGDRTYYYTDAGAEYALVKTGGIWSWGFSSRPNPPLSNTKSFSINADEFVFVSEEQAPLVIKVFRFNETASQWDTVMEYTDVVQVPTQGDPIQTCTTTEVGEDEVLVSTSLNRWGNDTGIYSTEMSSYTIKKNETTWGVTKTVLQEGFSNTTSPSSGTVWACSPIFRYELSDRSALHYIVPFAQALYGIGTESDRTAKLYRQQEDDTWDVLLEFPVSFTDTYNLQVVGEADKVVFYNKTKGLMEVYDASNGGFALEDNLNVTVNGQPLTGTVTMGAIGDTLTIDANSEKMTVGF